MLPVADGVERHADAGGEGGLAQAGAAADAAGIGGGVLEASTWFIGEETGLAPFWWAFLTVAGLSSLAAIPFLGLHPDAGASVSGRAPVARATSPVSPV